MRGPMHTDQKLRVPQAARRIGVTTDEMLNLIIDGTIPHTREGEFRLPFVAAADLDAYLARLSKS